MKTERDVFSALETATASPDYIGALSQLVAEWRRDPEMSEIAALQGSLRFIEANPGRSFGNPGSLVHYLESLTLEPFVASLSASVSRFPTSLTLWLLNRVLNDSSAVTFHADLLGLLKKVSSAQELAPELRQQAKSYIEFQSTK